MPSKHNRSITKFTAGEQAPPPELAAIDTIHIPNDLGRLALRIPQLEEPNLGDIVLEIDDEGRRVLRFAHAVVEVMLSNGDAPDGNPDDAYTAEYSREGHRRLFEVNGEYDGPGSELFIS